MPVMRYLTTLDDAVISTGLDAIRAELGVVEAFDAAASTEAEVAARRGPRLPPGVPDTQQWIDQRQLDLIAIDPAGSRDLDQAYTAEATPDGYRVWYAIADVAAFVEPGGPLEAASLQRGVTLYAPDRRASLHPVAINEHAASLLPGEDRPCCLWAIDLDHGANLVDAHVQRATVRVREAMSYVTAQTEIDSGTPRESLRLLAQIGELRRELERDRGAVSLTMPSQEIVDTDGGRRLVYDQTLPVETWNAQISLLTGIAAADIMLGAGTGLLRTLPPADPATVAELRRTAKALGVPWPVEETYPARVGRLDPTNPREIALSVRAATVLRGAGYVAFTDASEIPAEHEHSAIASSYAHVTAPLRRVCDRYANEVLLAVCAETPIPDWVIDTLAELPSVMGRARSTERTLDRTVLDYIEAVVLEHSVGGVFDAVVVSHRSRSRNANTNTTDDNTVATIQLSEPAVIASLRPAPELGTEVRVRLVEVDPAHRHIRFETVDA